MAEDAMHVNCQHTWTDVCRDTTARQAGGGADMRRYCDPHEVPTCGGTFVGEFVIASETTRAELLEALEGSSVRILLGFGPRRPRVVLLRLWGVDRRRSGPGYRARV